MTTTTRTNMSTTTRSLWRPAAAAAAAAAAATSAVAAVAHAAGVSLAISGEPIPIPGFAEMTLLAAILGFGLAVALRRWAGNPRRAFVRTAVTLTVLSFVPDLLVSAAVETRATLIATHIVAATIVIPVIAGRLAQGRD